MCSLLKQNTRLLVHLGFFNKARIFERIFYALKNRVGFEEVIIEKCTEILYLLSKNNESFVKEYKKEIIEIFEGDDFFKCNVNTLKIFSRLIDRFLDVTKHDIISAHFESFFNQIEF